MIKTASPLRGLGTWDWKGNALATSKEIVFSFNNYVESVITWGLTSYSLFLEERRSEIDRNILPLLDQLLLIFSLAWSFIILSNIEKNGHIWFSFYKIQPCCTGIVTNKWNKPPKTRNIWNLRWSPKNQNESKRRALMILLNSKERYTTISCKLTYITM